MTLYHATCVNFEGKGILILGPSGSGKSDLALRLIDVGASLVSDDYVEIEVQNGKLIATTAPNIEGLIEIRGVGLIKVDYIKSTSLALVLDLVNFKEIERLPDSEFFSHDDCQIPSFKFDAFGLSSVAKIRIILKNQG
jgi:HPr kinase/phosphorylase